MSQFTTYSSGLNNVTSIVFDNSNIMYVAVAGDNNIVTIDISGNKVPFAGAGATGSNCVFNYPEALVFDSVGFPDGYLYVMDSTSNIFKVDVTGNKVGILNHYVFSHFLGMVFHNNTLYYSSQFPAEPNLPPKGSIFGITVANNFTFFGSTPGAAGINSYPVGLDFDSIGNLYVAESAVGNSKIMKFASNGSMSNQNFILPPNPLYELFNLIIDSSDNIYATDTSSLYKYDSSGNQIGDAIYTDSAGDISALAFDNTGNLYFSNGANGSIITKYNPNFVCFKEDTKILTINGYILIQDLKKGDLIQTKDNGYVPIFMIGKKEIYHPAVKDRIKNQLYLCPCAKYPSLFEDLIITGCHSILVDDFKDEIQRHQTMEVNGDIFITDDKYRVPACVDDRTTPYDQKGNHIIYHLALENENYYFNYGIWANGLLVESCSKRYLKELSGMIEIKT